MVGVFININKERIKILTKHNGLGVIHKVTHYFMVLIRLVQDVRLPFGLKGGSLSVNDLSCSVVKNDYK